MANVQILKVGHALIQGVRGEKGGAPSKDSIWGIALVQNNPVCFWGRRNGKLRFRTALRKDQQKLLTTFDAKVAGKHKGFAYVEVDLANVDALVPNLAEMIGKTFYKDLGEKKLNAAKRTAAKQKAAAVAAPVAAPVPAVQDDASE